MNKLPFTEADEFRFKVSYQHNWISPTDHDPELDTPEHQVVMGGCDCCTTARDATKMTLVEYDELIEAGERALAMLRKIKQAVTGYDEFGEDSEGKCAWPECKCKG
jgi:hypothetical protein